MGKYVFEYYDSSDGSNSGDNDAWMGWFKELGDKVMDAGNPFGGNGMAVEKSGVSKIENFPCTGYTIVKADNMEEAVEIAKGCPLMKSDKTAVRVYEALPM